MWGFLHSLIKWCGDPKFQHDAFFDKNHFDWNIDDGGGYDENDYDGFVAVICCTNGFYVVGGHLYFVLSCNVLGNRSLYYHLTRFR